MHARTICCEEAASRQPSKLVSGTRAKYQLYMGNAKSILVYQQSAEIQVHAMITGLHKKPILRVVSTEVLFLCVENRSCKGKPIVIISLSYTSAICV